MNDPARARLVLLCDEAFDLTCRLWEHRRTDARLARLLIKAERRELRREDALVKYERKVVQDEELNRR